MSKQPPSSLKIGSFTYQVVFDQAAINEHSIRLQGFFAGYTDTARLRIALAEKNAIGEPLAPDYIRESLVHEVLHACLRASSCDPDADARANVPDVEERAVSSISGPLLGVLCDNPDLLYYLLDGVTAA